MIVYIWGFPGGSEVKTSACNAGDLVSIPGLGRAPGEGNSNPLQYSCLENPMDGGAWWAIVHGVTKGRTRLSDFTHFTSVYMSMLLFLFIPPSPSPTVSTSPFSTSDSLFLPCKHVHQYCFSDSIYMHQYMMFVFLFKTYFTLYNRL